MNRKQVIGRWGERLAEDYLTQRGLVLVSRNVRTPHGEIDLVMRQGEDLVFVEVKARTSDRFGMPEEAITPVKRDHMVAAAEYYIQNYQGWQGAWRVDVVAIRGKPGGVAPEVVWFENAIT